MSMLTLRIKDSTAATLKSNSVSNYEKENQKTKPLSEDIRQLQGVYILEASSKNSRISA